MHHRVPVDLVHLPERHIAGDAGIIHQHIHGSEIFRLLLMQPDRNPNRSHRRDTHKIDSPRSFIDFEPLRSLGVLGEYVVATVSPSAAI